MATYRSPFYPALQVFIDGDTNVKFVGGRAEVADDKVGAFEDYLHSPAGLNLGIVRDDGLVGQTDGENDPADELGPGYTPAEREAYRRARAQTAPPPPADQRSEGVKAAQSIPLLPEGVMPPAGERDPQVEAALREQELANERQAALGGAPGPADMGTADTAVDDELNDLTNDELKDMLREAGKPVSGNKDELIARLREED